MFAIFSLQLSNGRYTSIKPSSLEMTSIYLDLLRNEKPVFYDERTQRLWTGEEPTERGRLEP